MILKEIFNLPKLLIKYEQNMNKNANPTNKIIEKTKLENDKFSLLLKYENVNPELIP